MTNPIIAKYTFTIWLNKKGKRTIQVEMPPVPTTMDMDNIYSRCKDHYDKIVKEWFELEKPEEKKPKKKIQDNKEYKKLKDWMVKTIKVSEVRDMLWGDWCWAYIEYCGKHNDRSAELNYKIFTATNICFDCWAKYWTPTDKQIWVRKAKCDICWEEKTCAAQRDLGYMKK